MMLKELQSNEVPQVRRDTVTHSGKERERVFKEEQEHLTSRRLVDEDVTATATAIQVPEF